MTPPPHIDQHGRKINYLRVSITDRCNLRCFYCQPVRGLTLLRHQDILTFEEILRVVRAGVALGITKVRITGGEPLVRKGAAGLIEQIAGLDGVTEVALTTNGTLLAGLAKPLKEAGLHRVNVSLDSLNPVTFASITRRDRQKDVLAGIRAALNAGFDPVKINMVVVRGVNEREIADFAAWTLSQPVTVRFIEYMPMGRENDWHADRMVPSGEVQKRIESRLGPLETVVDPGPADGPARRFRLPRAQGEIGFIDAMSGHVCSRCNRLRLTADGRVLPCLFGKDELDVKDVLRSGGTDREVEALLDRAIRQKPLQRKEKQGPSPAPRQMSSVGG